MKQQNSLIVIALLIAAGSTTLKTSAQTAADNFPLPASIGAGSKVQIDGSSSLQVIHQGLQDRFQKQFFNADVTVPKQSQGSDLGVKSDVAGIGRLLTTVAQSQGLAAKSIGRSKIAIIVKDDNPYTGNLTLKDLAKIYPGDLTNLSQLPNGNGVSPSPTTTTETTTTTTATADRGFNPLWLLLLPVTGGLLWLLRKKPTPDPTPIATAPETTPTIKPLYPPPPSRTSRVDGLAGDLSGDLSSNLGSYPPAGNLQSGDLAGTLPLRPLDTPNTNPPPNINFNGVVEPVKTNASDINLAGGAAIVGGTAAAAALGKGIFDSTQETFGNRGIDRSSQLHPPEITDPDIDLSNPLEGLKDNSSNIMPSLDLNNPLEGSKGRGDSIPERGSAIADGAVELFDDRDNLLSADLILEEPNLDLRNPLSGIPAQTTESIPVDLHPTDTGTIDLLDFLKNGGEATVAAGDEPSGGAALFGGAGQSVSEFLSGKEDPFSAAPLAADEDELNDDPFSAAPLAADEDEINDDPFDFGNLFDPVENKVTEFQDNSIELLANDIDNDPFDFGNPLDLQDRAINPILDEIDFNLDDTFGDLTDNNLSNFFTTGSAAIGTAGAGVIGDAALFGGEKPQPEVVLPNPEMDTFDRDWEAINLADLDEDPFAGLSDLLGEETGDIATKTPQPELSDFFANLKERASDLVEDGKDLGGAALAGGAAATFGAGKAVQSFFAGKETPTSSAANPTDRPNVSGNLYSDGQITLVAASTTQAYAHWEIPVSLKRQLREQGGQRLVVRLYDVTNADVNIELPTIFQEFECSDSDGDLELPISQSEHRYLTEIGYVTEDGRWLMLARSAPLWIRSNNS